MRVVWCCVGGCGRERLKFTLEKRGSCGIDRVIDIIDYAVEDEKDAEDLRDWLDRKSKERFAKEHQRKI